MPGHSRQNRSSNTTYIEVPRRPQQQTFSSPQAQARHYYSVRHHVNPSTPGSGQSNSGGGGQRSYGGQGYNGNTGGGQSGAGDSSCVMS